MADFQETNGGNLFRMFLKDSEQTENLIWILEIRKYINDNPIRHVTVKPVLD